MMRTLVGLLACVLLLTACVLRQESGEEGSGCLIYFLAPADEARGGDLIRGSYEVLDLAENASLEERAAAVVERLIAGPEDGGLRSPLPAGVALQSLTIQDRRATVDLSGGFASWAAWS